MNFKQELHEMATELGADLFGVAPSSSLYGAPEGHRAEDILPGAKSVIILAMTFLDT